MPSQSAIRLYRTLRYRTPFRPALDASTRAMLRSAGKALTRPHDRRLFVIGHMRSGSSLLSNLLCSNDEINGYGESKVVLRGPEDLAVLRGKIAMVQMLNGQRPVRHSRYLFDKILHARLLPATTLLEEPKSKTIFLLRPPERTLRSIVGSFGWTVDQAADYLADQYPFLERLAAELPGDTDAVLLEHADLIQDTDAVLESVSEWLDLTKPLDQRYDPARVAKITGSGDTSDRINAGRVVRAARNHDVSIEGVDLPALEAMHARAVDAIRARFPVWTDTTTHA